MIRRAATNLWGDCLKYDGYISVAKVRFEEVNRMKKKKDHRSRKTFILLAVICHFLAAVKCSRVLCLNTESMSLQILINNDDNLGRSCLHCC